MSGAGAPLPSGSMQATKAPPYQVPTMAEVAAVEPNGYTMMSLFAGCGGSSLGYRMAGFKVLLANEFVPIAADCYELNAAPGTIVDRRDIRTVSGQELLDAAGVDEIDLLDGSPPCSAFSAAGRGPNLWNTSHLYSEGIDQRTDDLFFEYTRVLADIKPKVFVAENVAGLVRGSAIGYFKRIITAMDAAGYYVKARVLDASWLGVPQARRRLIFIGVRKDLDVFPVHPEALPYRRTIGDVLGPERVVVHDTSGLHSRGKFTPDESLPTITASGAASRFFRVAGPDPGDIWRDGYAHDPETGEVISLNDYAIGTEYSRVKPGHSSDKYFSLVRPPLDKPSSTVTATGGVLGAAGVVHPTSPRKFTLGELRAISGFPADFILNGNYKQRWERIGRAVPPLMMRAVAEKIAAETLPACVA